MNASEWSLIHSAYCLNLDRNTQRWIDSQAEFASVGLEVERVNCIESLENRYLSFNRSHYDTVKRIHDSGKPGVIFEDDIKFDERWKHIAEGMSQLPDTWDALYLGANICGDWQLPEYYKAHISRLPNAWMTHAIVYSVKGAKFILDNFKPDIITAENPVYDEWLRVNMMPMGNTFLLTPMICYQRPGYSDVWQNDTNYISVHFDGNKWLKQMQKTIA